MDILTEAQIKESVEMFANGMNRTEVAAHFIDTDPHIRGLIEEHGDAQIRRALSETLRAADPSSTRFRDKYKQQYQLHNEAAKLALANQYQAVVVRSITLMEAEIQSIQDQLDKLDTLLEGASETFPVGTSEYLATLNVRINLQKRMFEIGEKILERLERIDRSEQPF